MPIRIVRGHITRMEVDAIVNPLPRFFWETNVAYSEIANAAGPDFKAACRRMTRPAIGQAALTQGFSLPCKYILHTLYPQSKHDPRLLSDCCMSALELAVSQDCRSIAFPLLSTEIHGAPADEVLRLLSDPISVFLLNHEPDLTVYLVESPDAPVHFTGKLYADVQRFISHFSSENSIQFKKSSSHSSISVPGGFPASRQAPVSRKQREPLLKSEAAPCSKRQKAPSVSSEPREEALLITESTADAEAYLCAPSPAPAPLFSETAPWDPAALAEALRDVDESFSQMLLRLIDAKGMTDPQCYKRANISKQHFSKIRNDIHYQPTKSTAVALAIALRLGMPETEELLMKAGLALTRHHTFDLIIRYFIQHGEYDIFRINEILYAYDQVLLGSAG